jgi:hypothetical protein
MKKKERKYKKWVLVFFIFYTGNLFSQTPSVNIVADKTDILIGEQLSLKITANFPAGIKNIYWFTIPDSILHFEMVESGKIDSVINKDNSRQFQQTLLLTSFDSGRWAIPSFLIKSKGGDREAVYNLKTDSYFVNVSYAPADSTNQLRDIKPIIEVSVKNYLLYYIAAGVLLLLIAAFLIWRYTKKRKPMPELQFTGKLSPYEEAMQELDKLNKLNLQQGEEIKQFHAKAAAIFKWYISRKQRFSIMNKTTGDVLIHLTENKLPKQIITDVADALRCGDAVKFAKYLPPVTQSSQCFNKIKETIHFIHTSKPNNQ